MRSKRYLPALRAMKGDVQKRASRGERVIGSIFPSRLAGYASWANDQSLFVSHFKNWTMVAINLIASKTASVMPNMAYVHTHAIPGTTTKAGQRGLANLRGEGYGGSPLVDDQERYVTTKNGWSRDYQAPFSKVYPTVGFSDGGHSFLTLGEYRSKALSVVKPHEELEPLETDHRLRRLCENPNPVDSWYDLMYEASMFHELCGVDYLWTPLNEWGMPAEAWVIPSHWVWPRTGGGRYVDPQHPNADHLIQFYELRPWGGAVGSVGPLYLPPEEVVMTRCKSPLDKIAGYSKLAAIAQWIDSEESISKSRWAQFQNQARPEFWVELGPGYEDPDDDKIARLEAKFAYKIQGEYNYGRPVITPPGAKITPLSFNPTEMAYFQCLSDDTECLTAEGWKKHTELTEDTRIACYDETTGTLVYQKPTRIIRRHYTGEMYQFKSQRMDALVTPNHRLHVKRQPHTRQARLREPWQTVKVEELNSCSSYYMLRAAPAACDVVDTVVLPQYGEYRQATELDSCSIDPEVWLRFLGHFLSEGCLATRSEKQSGWRVGIAQHPNPIRCGDRSAAEMRFRSFTDNLRKTPFNWGTSTKTDGCVQWRVSNRGLYEHLLRHCGKGAANKRVPDYVKSWPAASLRILLDALIAGDGSLPQVTKSSKVWYSQYSTISKQLADDVMEIGIKCGLSASIHILQIRGRTHYRVNLSSRTETLLHPQHRSSMPYDGMIWCVTVPTGLFVVRRNGKAHITGNSEEQIRDMILSAFGVPKTAVGISTDMTYGSILATLSALCVYCLNPRFAQRGSSWTKHLASRWDEDGSKRSWGTYDREGGRGGVRRVRLWWDDCVPADPTQVNSDIQCDIQAYAVTPNEIRALRGRKPYKNGGDDPMGQGPGGVMPIPLNTADDLGDLAKLIAPMTSAEGQQTTESEAEGSAQGLLPPPQDVAGAEHPDEGGEDQRTPAEMPAEQATGTETPEIEEPNGKPSKELRKALNYVRVTCMVATESGTGKRRTFWANKLGTGRYRVSDREGELRNEYVLLGPGDLIEERLAVMNNHYGELEVKGYETRLEGHERQERLGGMQEWLGASETLSVVRGGAGSGVSARMDAGNRLSLGASCGAMSWKDWVGREAEKKADHPFTVAVDLDGTLADYSQGWQGLDVIGDPLPGAKEALEEFKRRGWEVIIFTTRGDVDRVMDWLGKHGMPYDYVNENPGGPEATSGKVLADVYVDDHGVRFTDWDQARRDVEALAAVKKVWSGVRRKALGDPETLIDLPDVRQRDDYSCGAAIAMSVGKYFGVGPETLEEWKASLGTTEQTSTRPAAIAAYLASLGLEVAARYGMGLDDLREAWRQGRPVICCCQEYGVPSKQASEKYGHYVAVIGLALGLVIVQDPSVDNALGEPGGSQGDKERADVLQAPGRMPIEEARWLRAWHDKDVDGNEYNRYGIVVGPPTKRLGRLKQRGAGICKPGQTAERKGWVTLESGTHVFLVPGKPLPEKTTGLRSKLKGRKR